MSLISIFNFSIVLYQVQLTVSPAKLSASLIPVQSAALARVPPTEYQSTLFTFTAQGTLWHADIQIILQGLALTLDNSIW